MGQAEQPVCITIDLVVTHWKKLPEGTIKDYYRSGSFLWGGLFYLFCCGEWLARSREKAVGVHRSRSSGEACLVDWQTGVPVLDLWWCAPLSAGSTAL